MHLLFPTKKIILLILLGFILLKILYNNSSNCIYSGFMLLYFSRVLRFKISISKRHNHKNSKTHLCFGSCMIYFLFWGVFSMTFLMSFFFLVNLHFILDRKYVIDNMSVFLILFFFNKQHLSVQNCFVVCEHCKIEDCFSNESNYK